MYQTNSDYKLAILHIFTSLVGIIIIINKSYNFSKENVYYNKVHLFLPYESLIEYYFLLLNILLWLFAKFIQPIDWYTKYPL